VTPDAVLRLQHSPIGRLAHCLYPLDPSGRYFVVFAAYYDESGTHDGSPITVLGGLVGSVDQWAGLEREWRKILKKYDLRFVRAKQLFHRQGPYKKWPRKQLEYLWNDLLYVFQEHPQLQVSKIVLNHEDYYRSYIGEGPISKKERLDTKYALCVRVALNFLPMVHHGVHAPGAINFIAEAGHRNQGDALRVFTELKNQKSYPWSGSIGAISFGTKPDFPALQAADLISYWFYKTEMEKIAAAAREEDNYDNNGWTYDEDGDYWYDAWTPWDISELEQKLVRCGISIIEHIIQPRDLANLRQNFLAKNKRKTFDKARAVIRAQDFIPGTWDTESANQLFGVEVSVDSYVRGLRELPFRARNRG
jgi:hypothetical protein